MKLKSVRVRMFRNILDSTEVKIESKVTCLVGKNESGKSAFLNALWRLNPARRKPTFSIPDHYPAWLEKRHRNEGMDQDEVKPIEVELEWEAADVRALEEKFGPGVVKTGTKLILSRNYDNKFGWISGCNEQQAVKNFVERQELLSPETYAGIPKFETLAAKLDEDLAKNADVPEVLAGLTNAQAALKTLFGERGEFGSAAWRIAQPRLPQFFYFADYSKLPYSVKIDRVLKEDDLDESEATARALLSLGGTEDEYILNPDYERRKRELENVANVLTDDVNKYWTQNPELRVQPDITQRTLQR